MVDKIRIEPKAEKFVIFKMEDGSFFLRALNLNYHMDIYHAFARETSRAVECFGAKFLVAADTVTLYGLSASWGHMPEHWKSEAIALFTEAYPEKQIVERWDAI